MTSPQVAAAGDDRRSEDAIALLSRRMNTVCVNAVDELQIAAAIEAQGINDKAAQTVFGKADVFELARHLYEAVPLRPEADPNPERPRIHFINDLVRGIAYLVPTLLYLGLSRILALEAAAGLLMGTLVFVWSASQGMVFLQQRLLGRRSQAEAFRVISLASLAVVIAVTWVTGVYVLARGLDLYVFLAVVGQTVYFLGASVLFSIRAEKLLLATLLPGALLSFLTLPSWGWRAPAWLLAVVLLGTVGAVAFQALRVSGVSGGRMKIRLAPGEGTAALAHVGQGFLWAVFVVAGAYAGTAGFRQPSFSVAALPLVLSLGVAEWQVRMLGERTRRLMGRHSDPETFRFRSTIELVASAAAYSAVVGLLGVATGAILSMTGRLDARSVVLLQAFFFLGLGLFVGLALAARGAPSLASLGSMAGLTAMVLTDLMFFPQPGIDAISYLVSTVVLAMSLLALAFSQLPRPVIP